MNIHTQFTFNHFLILAILLLVLNLILMKVKKVHFKIFFNWKILIVVMIVTLLGLFYSEIKHSGDFMIKSFGYPRDFYFEKVVRKTNGFTLFTISYFNYFNFIQNFILYFLSLNLIIKIFKKSKNLEK